MISNKLRRETARTAFQFVRRPFKQHFAASAAPFWPQIDDPIGLTDHVQMVLDEDNRVASVHQAINDAHQHTNVGEMQPGGGFVHHVDATLFVQFGGKLEPLPFAAGQRAERLAQAQITQPYVVHGL